jgi:hypothetical protein
LLINLMVFGSEIRGEGSDLLVQWVYYTLRKLLFEILK